LRSTARTTARCSKSKGVDGRLIYQGDVAQQAFLAFYVLNNRIVAVSSMNHDTEPLYITELLGQQQLPTPEAVRAGLEWASLANKK
jgi:hypothetical protein